MKLGNTISNRVFKALMILTSFACFSIGATPSAYRTPGTSYLDYLSKEPLAARPFGTVESSAKEFDEGTLKEILDKTSMTEFNQSEGEFAFKSIRDQRFLTVRQDPSFLRRISWLYPDDGCFARADLAKTKFHEMGFKEIKKVFIFGDLQAETTNSPNGMVTWWFHVVPLIKIEGQYYAVDPAIDPKSPLPLLDWVYAMAPDLKSVEIAVCDGNSYDPGSNCEGGQGLPMDEVVAHQKTYLSYEWFRMKEMGRDPKKVLGDEPPWLE